MGHNAKDPNFRGLLLSSSSPSNQAESHTFKAKKRIDIKRTKNKNKKLTAIALSTKFGTEKRNSPRTFNCSDQTHHKYSGKRERETERDRGRDVEGEEGF
jgi:hypothetical protein